MSPTVADVLTVLGVAANFAGIWFAGAALLGEARDSRITPTLQRRTRRAWRRVASLWRKPEEPRVIGTAEGGGLALGGGGYVEYYPVDGTGDPVEDRFRQLEADLQREEDRRNRRDRELAKRTSELAADLRRHRKHVAEQRRDDRVEHRAALRRSVDRELGGLILVVVGTTLQSIAQLLTGSS